jgi:hypothetical protein
LSSGLYWTIGAQGTYFAHGWVTSTGTFVETVQTLWVVAMVVGLAWGHVDVRATWASLGVALPFLAYQLADHIAAGGLYTSADWWQSHQGAIAATAGLLLLAASGAHATLRNDRQRTGPARDPAVK